MGLPLKTLSVYANPYAAIDHCGRPAGHFSHDVSIPGMAGRYVGATMIATLVQPEVTRTIGKATEVLNHAVHDRTWEFSQDPVTVVNNQHYLQGLKDGALFPADEKTAALLGKKLRPLAECLKEARAAAEQAFDSSYGVGSFAEINPEPAKASKK
jgi:hypothetical protein